MKSGHTNRLRDRIRALEHRVEELIDHVAELEAELEAKSQEAYAANVQAHDSWQKLDDRSRQELIRERMRFA
jgi:flagellar biosynthesis chaperone FliJ